MKRYPGTIEAERWIGLNGSAHRVLFDLTQGVVFGDTKLLSGANHRTARVLAEAT